ncbi:MAG: hypothetical protein QOD78_2177 [Chloroflexota bacterium]|jgi:hypothetical protein|nr:hypothetical protein [Chloroflexota bacterium]
MHVQAKAAPKASPADLAEFLKVLAANRESERDAINIEGATGAAIEGGGDFVFTVTEGRARDAHDRLTEAGYHVEWTWDLYHERIPPEEGSGEASITEDDDPNQPGILLGIVRRAKRSELAAGRNIDTVLINALTNEPGFFYVQVTFEGAEWQHVRPGEED